MVEHIPDDNTTLLSRAADGDRQSAALLVTVVYDELRALAAARLRRERPDHTLVPTAVVHEVYLRLVDQTRANVKSRTHFLAIAAQEMRRVLVDHARKHRAAKRGGGRCRLALDPSLAVVTGEEVDAIDLEEAIADLSRLHERQARVVELRFFGGLAVRSVAEVLDVSLPTVERDWRLARAWLYRRLRST